MTSFYVDSSVSASGNGTSWTSSWKTFSDISWSVIKPGDTLYISGGTYRETLTVGASGSPGQPITITTSNDQGHNGPVIIDGQNARVSGVVVNGRNHVEVDNLSIRNHAGAGVSVKNATAGVVIENNDVYSGDPGGGNARGYDVRDSAGVVVRGNSFSTPTSTAAQTDGIWSSGNNGVVFENNRLVISNNNTAGHSDGIQSYLDYNITIRNNYIEQANNAATDNHGMWLSDTRNGGVLEIYNNIVYVPNLTRDSAVTHWAEPTWSETGTIKLWANTIYGGSRSVNLDKTPNAEVMNNILVPASGGFGVVMMNGKIPGGNINNNLIWAPNASVAYVEGSTKDWSGWQSLGYDRSGVNADPKFADLAGKLLALTSSSPAIDKGAALAKVTVDYAGTPRPQGAGYDIGAYETPGSAGPVTPAPTPERTPIPAPKPTPGFDPALRDVVPTPGSLTGDTAYKSSNYSLRSWQENLVQTGTSDITGRGNSGENVLIGNTGSNSLAGNDGGDDIYGNAGNDRIYGGNHDDWLWGGGGNDLLSGDAGKDMLIGGSGADRFVIGAASHSRPGGNYRDAILDFNRPEGDKIDFSALDANTSQSGNQAFSFIGTATFTGKAGQLHLVRIDNGVIIEGDLNGDRVADFQVEVWGGADMDFLPGTMASSQPFDIIV